MRRRLTEQFSWILLGRVIAAALQAVILAILARSLGPQQFGVVAATLGVIILLQAMADLGMGKLVVRERSAGDSETLLAGGLWINARSSLVLCLALAIGFLSLGLFIDHAFLLMLPLAVSAAGEKNADTWLGVAIADGDTHLNSINLVSRRTIALVSFLILNYFGFPPILSYSVSVALAALGSVIFARRHVSRLALPVRASISHTIGAAQPYWINTLAVQFRNLDAGIVGIVASPVAAGFYATASKLSSPLRMLPTSLAVVILPHAARTRHRSAYSILRLVFFAGALVGLVYVLLVFFVPWGLPVLLGEAYRPAVVPLQIVLVGLIFAAFTSLFGAAMQGRGLSKSVAAVSVSSTIYLLLALVIFTGVSGSTGAAIALATSYMLESIALGVCFSFKALRKENNGG